MNISLSPFEPGNLVSRDSSAVLFGVSLLILLPQTESDAYSQGIIEYIACTEQGENHGTMILDGVCYPVTHLCRVILSRMVELSYGQSVSGRLSTSVVSSPDVPMLI